MLKTVVLVIKKQNLGEVDRIITVLSPDLGKRRLVARGIRKPLSKLAGHLDTMMLTRVMLTEEDELAKIANADLEEPFKNLRANLALTQRAWAIVGLAERVALEGVSQRGLFSLVTNSLRQLDAGANWERVWLYYLANLSKSLGLGDSYRHCPKCAATLESGGVLSEESGQVVCLSCAPKGKHALRPSALKLINVARQSPFSAFQKIRWQDSMISREVEQIILNQLSDHLNVPWRQLATLT